jgi:polyhydroxyalkanoate synthesis regulator phasin
MKLIVIFLTCVFLVGCNKQTMIDDRIDVADVNARNALAKAQQQSDRIERLERRVAELEGR